MPTKNKGTVKSLFSVLIEVPLTICSLASPANGQEAFHCSAPSISKFYAHANVAQVDVFNSKTTSAAGNCISFQIF